MHVSSDSLIKVQSFFRACLRENGVLVPGSERIGHNVLTDNGRNWLANLISWNALGTPDVPHIDSRVRWIGVGDDSHAAVTEAVNTLKNAVSITTAPDIYLAQLDAPPTHLSPVWVKFARTLQTPEVSHSGDVTVVEAGLYVDVKPNLLLNGDFADWTTDDPDDWDVVVLGGGDVTERGYNQGHAGAGSGACNIYRTSGGIKAARIEQADVPLIVGRTYEFHADVGFVGDPSVVAAGSGMFGLVLNSVGHHSISFIATAETVDFSLAASGGTDVTIDNVGIYPAGMVASPQNPLNPVVAYKAFEGLLKSAATTLDLEWSFRF